MADGKLVRILLKTGVSAYLDWRCIDGTFVYQYKKGGFFSKEGGKIARVPATEGEVLKSSLMGWNEKRKCRNFILFV